MTAAISSAGVAQSEAETLLDFETGAPERVRIQPDIDGARAGGGMALSMCADPARFWSTALWFGFSARVTAHLIEEVGALCRTRGTPMAAFLLAPSGLPPRTAPRSARKQPVGRLVPGEARM
jgi:hypothetical protein